MALFKGRIRISLGEDEYPECNKNASENSIVLLHRFTKSGDTRLRAPAKPRLKLVIGSIAVRRDLSSLPTSLSKERRDYSPFDQGGRRGIRW